MREIERGGRERERECVCVCVCDRQTNGEKERLCCYMRRRSGGWRGGDFLS